MGYIETLFILLLAFLVIGPRDFPSVMFKLGDFWRRFLFMARRFYDQWEEMAINEDTSLEKSSFKKKKSCKNHHPK